MKLVIVESPAKAKTINKYLGKDYMVMASFGHIRDVPAKNNSVRPEEDFAMDWEVQSRGEKTVRDMIKALSKAESLYLASDPDREGEAIAWHVVQELKRRKKLPENLPVYRVVLHEITKNAILEAIKNPREIDMQLVNAYLARRALDYLVGFKISPLLWRNLPGANSAGRVHSVALRLVCEREDEIASFKPEEYWTLNGQFKTIRQDVFKARLTHYNGKKLTKFDLNNETLAKQVENAVKQSSYSVGTIERKQTKRNPAPAFTTSTLQQEASRKLGFGAKKTMQLAQGLYEGVDIGGETVGLITYMRTDSVALSQEAITATRTLIEKEYGKEFLPDKPRLYKNNSKNAQEAHEAIRPTNVLRTPDSIAGSLSSDQRKLYELIWKRTVACQMESAVLDKVGIDIPAQDGQTQFRATGQTIAFAGFIKVYKEDIDDAKQEDDENGLLPLMNEGEKLDTISVLSEQHFTEPPPRFSEASLVKKLEELGIGRPSTYATILSVLQERAYVKLVAKKFIPEDRGRIVTAFMENYFTRYVQYDYTALMENKLDDITNGDAQWKEVLTDFWGSFDSTVQSVPNKMGEILEKVSASLEKQIFPTEESRKCPDCETGSLSLHIGKFGAFIGCSNYPTCKHTKQYASLTPPPLDENGHPLETIAEDTNKELGKNENGIVIFLKKGPYGWYVQEGDGKQAKRTGLPKSMKPESVTMDVALKLLALPRFIGYDPDTKEPVEASIGRFGPYVKRGKTFQSLEASDSILTVTLERALQLLSQSKTKKQATEIGKWNDDVITYQIGRYGPYVKWGKLMASVKNKNDVPTLEEAIRLLQDKIHEK